MNNNNQETVQIDVYWIRHGYSCANLLKTLGKAGVANAVKKTFKFQGFMSNTRGVLVPNTDLSIIGVEQAEYVSDKFRTSDWYPQVDMICASEAVRAIETALLVSRNILNDNSVYILPYTSEVRHRLAKLTGGDTDNIPQERGITLRKIHTFNHYMITNRENFIERRINYSIKDMIERNLTINGDVKKIKEDVLPVLFTECVRRNPGKERLRIIIVSHQKTIRKLHGIDDYKVPNCGIVSDNLMYHVRENIYEGDMNNFNWIYPRTPLQPMPLTLKFPDDSTCPIETNLNIKINGRQVFDIDVKRCIETHHVSLCGANEGTTPAIRNIVRKHVNTRRVVNWEPMPSKRNVNTNASSVTIANNAANVAEGAAAVEWRENNNLKGGAKNKIYIKSIGYRKIRKTKKGRKYIIIKGKRKYL